MNFSKENGAIFCFTLFIYTNYSALLIYEILGKNKKTITLGMMVFDLKRTILSNQGSLDSLTLS